MFDVHRNKMTEAVLKCVLQPGKDKAVTGKLSCLPVLGLKATHLTITITVLFA